ncbi:MAG: hypothetical protein ACE5IQ_05965 [Candidatus Methylomirabilales bacterium]
MRPLCYLILVTAIMAGCAKPKAVVVPPRPAPSRPHRMKEKPPSPPRKLSPRVGREEEHQLKQKAETRIEEAENLFERIDQKKLDKDQREIFSTVRSFLSKAKAALSIRDFLRALNLADKARILAEELSHTVR